MKALRLFVIESPSPIDLLKQRSEGNTIELIARLLGHDVAILTAGSENAFVDCLDLISSIDEDGDYPCSKGIPLVIHVACHGGPTGLVFGATSVSWKNLAKRLNKFGSTTTYSGPIVLTISACHAGQQRITIELQKLIKADSDFVPPKYLFVTAGDAEGDVHWAQAIVTWALFYQQLSNADFNDPSTIKPILRKINRLQIGSLYYFRWNPATRRYLRFSGN